MLYVTLLFENESRPYQCIPFNEKYKCTSLTTLALLLRLKLMSLKQGMALKKVIILIFIMIVLKLNNANENGLNRIHYSRVLNDIKPLIPKKKEHELIKYSNNKLVLFIDKECSNNKHRMLFDHLLNKYSKCIHMINNEFGDNNDGIYHTDNDWFIFVKLHNNIKCLHNNIINYRHYCISNFRYSRQYSINAIEHATCSKNTNPYKFGNYT